MASEIWIRTFFEIDTLNPCGRWVPLTPNSVRSISKVLSRFARDELWPCGVSLTGIVIRCVIPRIVRSPVHANVPLCSALCMSTLDG